MKQLTTTQFLYVKGFNLYFLQVIFAENFLISKNWWQKVGKTMKQMFVLNSEDNIKKAENICDTDYYRRCLG